MIDKMVYAGSFDPLTNGHLDLILRGSKMCDTLIVCVGNNVNKRYTFSATERVVMINRSIQQLNLNNCIVINNEDETLAHFADRRNISHILRGVRNASDYVAERDMCQINNDICQGLETVLLMASPAHQHISSSAVRELYKFPHWESVLEHWVPAPVFENLVKIEKYKGLSAP